jgi:hypothetical protein
MEEPCATLENLSEDNGLNAVKLIYNNVGSLFDQLGQIHSALDPECQRRQSASFSHFIKLVLLSWGG